MAPPNEPKGHWSAALTFTLGEHTVTESAEVRFTTDDDADTVRSDFMLDIEDAMLCMAVDMMVATDKRAKEIRALLANE